MIIPMLCVTIFVILVVWFLLPRVARLMIHTPTAISIFVCLSMVQLMAVFISKQELLLLVYELNRSGLLAENEKIRPILAQLEKLLLCDLSPSTNDSVKN